ncbi:hypothetical protein AKI39_11165 [Bordetella sp. H567]|uniref:NEL-type E3 ubiquitin ligase domain-containing protein n=1 Tax=Bordetella sp. H567 TaxID=1697043 RepID=UPI00081D0752|nr:NEL-type E3 ubiquitin ligase domain-containing protein [Bordetella sp. H567]AOB31140.1 hypothetical protein AKI39_11165 [Bordetella sp. H567]
MHTPISNAQSFDAMAHLLAASLRQAGPGQPLQPALPGPYPASFADLLYAIVTGDPSPVQLQFADAHFRDINRMEDGAAALRQLRSVSALHGRYPTLAFTADTLALPLLTFEQPPGVPASDADDALRAAVAAVSQMQLRLVSHQYLSLLAGTMDNVYRQLLAGQWPNSSLMGAAAMHGTQDAMAQAAATLDRPLQLLWPGAESAAAVPAETAGGPIRVERHRRPFRPEPYMPTPAHVASYTHEQHTADRPIGGLIEHWMDQPDPELAARWTEIDEPLRHTRATPPTLSFKRFLLGLTHSHIYRSGTTREEVAQWLVQAAQPGREALRAEAFRICDEGSIMCRDNALLTWNRLKMLLRKAEAMEGQYADRLGELCHLALTTLRWETLESVAQAKIQALHKENQERQKAGVPLIIIDPVEIMLDYQVNLAEALHLPLSVKGMAFPDLSPVTDLDIQQAKEAITRIEADSIATYLMLDFTPFLAEVRRQIGPDACRAVERALYESLDGFEERVDQRLQALKLPTSDDPLSEDARREMGVRVDRELRYSAWLPHANAVLAAAGMAPLPALEAAPPAVPPSP